MSVSTPHTDGARIGPNAVIQLGETLLAHDALGLAQRIYLAAGHLDWLRDPPASMVSETDVAALHRALQTLATPQEAREYAVEAGLRTGDYILAHRIPRAAQAILRALPARLASRLLLKAISHHAWTFAGSGRFVCEPGPAVRFSIAANPLARRGGCVWHEAVFTRLFQALVHPNAVAREIACCASGDDACRFEIRSR
ncbi:MAG: bacteriochlorophyll 4-vinyl reductase [Beijerinckiaceae bacterium]